MNPTLSLDHLCTGYGSRTVLHDLTLQFATGCITAIMGANGCGKTTLLRTIAGNLTPVRGRVLLNDADVASLSARNLAQQMAVVHQRILPDFEFTAYDTVMMGRNPYQSRLSNPSQADKQIVEQALQQTGTLHLRNKLPSEMSGGELQRVMIARALAQQTPYLLMDEPVSNLDIAHQLEVMRLLRSMTDKTILIVIHDLNLALQFCHRLLLLHEGKAYFHGAVHEGLTPQHIAQVYGVQSHLSDNRIVFEY